MVLASPRQRDVVPVGITRPVVECVGTPVWKGRSNNSKFLRIDSSRAAAFRSLARSLVRSPVRFLVPPILFVLFGEQ